ncbi:TIR domain-containing protein [Bradyrhizobium sp. LMTR 3]|uniref:TIR domain-containing protein n=1 Tax=Bradyrhizobium sp. LMTR 3 TaxID=189873 RepID=UPI0008103762|nr:TIR domain-containing protein [Bradyrhizobium sp. LMTR 3]OCK61219.1 hypothetical protein LMTR3_23660 [Bradyrhizobium sp. LMTR 3]
MPQRVFFSFDFDRDLQTARQVRDAWELHGKGESLPLYDAVEFEEATQRAGGINNWIDDQLRECSVVAVLVGYETYKKPWILYGIRKSAELNLGILAIDVHKVRDPHAGTDISHGLCPLDFLRLSMTKYRRYDWMRHEGDQNIADWVEFAAEVVRPNVYKYP